MANSIRFKFISLQSSEIEVGNLLFDFDYLESIINDELKNHYFGNDVKEFQLLVHTYVFFNGLFSEFFNSLKGKKGYKTNGGILFATKDLNYAELKGMDQEQQVEIIKGVILESIEEVKKIGRIRNTDFETDRFKNVLSEVLENYGLEVVV